MLCYILNWEALLDIFVNERPPALLESRQWTVSATSTTHWWVINLVTLCGCAWPAHIEDTKHHATAVISNWAPVHASCQVFCHHPALSAEMGSRWSALPRSCAMIHPDIPRGSRHLFALTGGPRLQWPVGLRNILRNRFLGTRRAINIKASAVVRFFKIQCDDFILKGVVISSSCWSFLVEWSTSQGRLACSRVHIC